MLHRVASASRFAARHQLSRASARSVSMVGYNFHKEPAVNGVAGQWASGLIQTAKKAGADSAKISAELGKLYTYIKAQPSFGPMMSLPVYSDAKKKELAGEIVKSLNLSPITVAFFQQMAPVKGFMNTFPRFKEYFDELSRYERKEVLSTVRTAEPLTKEQMDKLRAKVQGIIGNDLKVVFETKIDPSVLGGMVISVGDLLQDLSARRQVETLQKVLQSY